MATPNRSDDPATSLRIGTATIDDPDVRALIAFHVADMQASSPKELAFALDPDRFRDPALTLFAARSGDTLAAVAALRALGDGLYEIKSMRAAPACRGQGAGRALLRALIDHARAQGGTALLLETGTGPVFAAAEGLYRAHGFLPCPAFGDYPADSPFNRYFRLDLAA